MYKLTFYVPPEHLEKVKNALFQKGAGKVGQYDCCAWQTKGMGQYRPLKGSHPYQGQTDIIESVKEYLVEMVCKDSLIQSVVEELKRVHPYEEVAYAIYKIDKLPPKVNKKLSKEETGLLIGRLAPLRITIDTYKAINKEANVLVNSVGNNFFGLAQKILGNEIYVAFIAIISGNEVKNILKLHHCDECKIKQDVTLIEDKFKTARDKYYAHMDLSFNLTEAPPVDLEELEALFDKLLEIINHISEEPLPGINGSISVYVLSSLHAVIAMLQRDRDIENG